MTINDLCNKVLVYILSINISNKTGVYTQSGYLGVNGTNLKTYTCPIQYCPSASGNTGPAKVGEETTHYTNVTVTQYIKTSESISSVYCNQATNDRITSDWNKFKDTYISQMLNSNETLSLSSVFVFMYLVRCFIDARFALFTDTYHRSYVWLYNTNTTVDYKIDSSVIPANFTETSGVGFLDKVVSALVDEVSDRRSVHILKSTSGTSVV